jgi:hypothetical protein
MSGLKAARQNVEEKESLQMDILQNLKEARKKVEITSSEAEASPAFKPFDYSQVQLPAAVAAETSEFKL